ncbi:MAG: hypothetical protein ACQSGP_21650 [Frankia sp.]
MSGVRFVVENVFNITGRGGLLLAGRLESGVIEAGSVLRDAASAQPLHVLGLEFHSAPGQPTIVLAHDPASAAVATGAVLVSAAPAAG